MGRRALFNSAVLRKQKLNRLCGEHVHLGSSMSKPFQAIWELRSDAGLTQLSEQSAICNHFRLPFKTCSLFGGCTITYRREIGRADEVSKERNREKLDNLGFLHFCNINRLDALFEFLQGFTFLLLQTATPSPEFLHQVLGHSFLSASFICIFRCNSYSAVKNRKSWGKMVDLSHYATLIFSNK